MRIDRHVSACVPASKDKINKKLKTVKEVCISIDY